MAAALAGIDYIQDCLALRFGSSKAYHQLQTRLAEILQQIRSTPYNQ